MVKPNFVPDYRDEFTIRHYRKFIHFKKNDVNKIKMPQDLQAALRMFEGRFRGSRLFLQLFVKPTLSKSEGRFRDSRLFLLSALHKFEGCF